MKLLLVEDNRALSDWLKRTLQKDGYTVECCFSGDDAQFRLRSEAYDLVILDLALPGARGEDVLHSLRARQQNLPVLILTAQDAMAGRLDCLNNGADDYVTKPFNVAELEARIRVLLRRHSPQRNPLIHCGDLRYDRNSRLFYLHDAQLALTPREHAVLEVLLLHMDTTVSKKKLADKLFTIEEAVSVDAIEIYIHRLRKKLHSSLVSITTLRGLGYLLRAHAV